MSTIEEVIIIGSGPAGYTAGLYTGRAMLNPKLFAGFASKSCAIASDGNVIANRPHIPHLYF